MKTHYNQIVRPSKETPGEKPPKQKKQKQNASASPSRASRSERAALRSQQADNVSKKKNLKKPGLKRKADDKEHPKSSSETLDEPKSNEAKSGNIQEVERIPSAPDGVGSGPDNAKTSNIQEEEEIRSAPDGVGSGPDKADEEQRIPSAPDGVISGPSDPRTNNADPIAKNVLDDKDILRHLCIVPKTKIERSGKLARNFGFFTRPLHDYVNIDHLAASSFVRYLSRRTFPKKKSEKSPSYLIDVKFCQPEDHFTNFCETGRKHIAYKCADKLREN